MTLRGRRHQRPTPTPHHNALPIALLLALLLAGLACHHGPRVDTVPVPCEPEVVVREVLVPVPVVLDPPAVERPEAAAPPAETGARLGWLVRQLAAWVGYALELEPHAGIEVDP